MLPLALALMAAIDFGIGATPRTSEPQTGTGAPPKVRMKSKTSDMPAKKFVRGPSVQPVDHLVAWFDHHRRSFSVRMLRVPLVLKRGKVGFSLRGARIGSASDAVELYVNDSALGIGLDDRALTHCKGRPTCAFWVEGKVARDEDGKFRFDVMRVSSPIKPDALASANYIEVEELEIPEPAEPEQGFPIPTGAHKNDSPGGATSLAPGRNYTLKVYDVGADVESIAAFYDRYLPEAKRASEGEELKFSTPRGSVKLSASGLGTRITIAVGPQ